MQTDILASKPLTATGQIKGQNDDDIGRARIKAIYIIPAAVAGSIVFRDGGASGPIRSTINTLASSTSPTYINLPSAGLLFTTDVHVTLTSVASVTVFHG